MATLDEQYLQAVNTQRHYLTQLQNAFKQHCEEINAATLQKLLSLPETDHVSRQATIAEQKKKLEEALNQLKLEMDRSMTITRKKLEEIYIKREEEQIIKLEKLIQ